MSLDPAGALPGYVIGHEIGRGASGVVYIARQELLDRRVALKRVPDDGAAHRLDREVAALVALEHPGVVRLMDVVRRPGEVWFVMEYVDGPTLRQIVDTGPLPVPEALRILEQLSAVLDFVASRGIVHRDLKPGNVFITSGGRAKVGDFGIALLGGDAGARVTRPGTVVGTPAYLSPEQARGQGEPTAASDLYSLGVIAYELLAGRVPFRRPGNVLALLAAQETEPPPPPSGFRPELAGAVESALLAPLAKDPDKRPASAGEFFAQLSRAADRTWPGWREAVNPVRVAPVVSRPAPATDEKTITADAVLTPEPVKSIRKRRRPQLRRYLAPVGVFAVALGASYAAVNAFSSGDGAGLQIDSVRLSCAAGMVTATLTTNQKNGDLVFRWSDGGQQSEMVNGQRVITVSEPATGGAVTLFLISPQTRKESLPGAGGC